MRPIKKIIVHCSASEFGDAAAIDRWHKERGWEGIGYHFVILNGVRVSRAPYNAKDDGLIEFGRSEATIGAHCKGQNKESLGICIIGEKTFTPDQIMALYRLLRKLLSQYCLQPKDVWGHYEFEPHKTCPNLDMGTVRSRLQGGDIDG